MFGYKEFEGRIRVEEGKPYLELIGQGFISANEYIRNGFRVMEATRPEIEGLIAGGYERSRLRMRFFEFSPED